MAGVSRFDDSSELDAFLKSDYGPRVDYLYANRRGEQVICIHKRDKAIRATGVENNFYYSTTVLRRSNWPFVTAALRLFIVRTVNGTGYVA